jgi:hypothetical protein
LRRNDNAIAMMAFYPDQANFAGYSEVTGQHVSILEYRAGGARFVPVAP